MVKVDIQNNNNYKKGVGGLAWYRCGPQEQENRTETFYQNGFQNPIYKAEESTFIIKGQVFQSPL